MKLTHTFLASIAAVSLAMTAHSEEPVAAPAPHVCPELSPEGAVFMEGVVERMMDPDSNFTHASVLSAPEFHEIRARDERLLKEDWGNVCKYQKDNETVLEGQAPKVVFMGDSITEFWRVGDKELFTDGVIDRGISGQTSSQMLVRFWQDVVALKPQAVHIMAGTNDLAENTGYVSDEAYKNNIRSMTTLAQSNDIAVILASIPPADVFGWRPELQPAKRIDTLNAWLENYAAEVGAVYVDYHSLLSEDGEGMMPKYTPDGVHPNRLGYAAIHDTAEAAITKALQD